MTILAEFKKTFHDPHNFLGVHTLKDGSRVIRLWRPGAHEIHFEVQGQVRSALKIDDSGLFELSVSEEVGAFDYQVYHQNGLLAHDPYAFLPTFGELDGFLFNQGVHYQIYEALGAHPVVHQGVAGVKFAVWAPHARQVALVGDFNFWDGRVNPMRSLGKSGVWELFVPGLTAGEKYKFEIRSQEGHLRIKSDPYANFHEMRPRTASIVADLQQFTWGDQKWMGERIAQENKPFPLNIYEVHLGSWKRRNGEFLSYRELAEELASYCNEMGFTHVELMPIEEHPLDESWGYQVIGFYAVTSRYGSVEDFQYFVNHLHLAGIGVILDWVPAHFPTDDFSLACFDGSCLYEHADPRQGYHPHWNTLIFNYGRREVTNFLLGSALFWLEKMHIDGLRVDAVASMLYLDYGREKGEWIPNSYGGNENLEAIEFLKHLNAIIHNRCPGVLMCAEESTSFMGVTHPLERGGLGFDLKWNMGWMNDTLRYFQTDSFFRHYHHNHLTFGLIYAFSERFMLPFSHDEVVHGKRSLLSKMPGDDWQKFANLRLLLSYQICQPGKKLLFMGDEFASRDEWSCSDQLPWQVLQYPPHAGIHRMVKELNQFYLQRSELWELDFDARGFEWIDFSDRVNSVISYQRKGAFSSLVCVHNFTPEYFPSYFIGLSHVRGLEEVFNTDRKEYGGSGKTCSHPKVITDEHGHHIGFEVQLAPLASMIFSVEFLY